MTVKPMLAATGELDKLPFPILAAPKLDGIRALAINGEPISRSLKLIRNKFVQKWFADHPELHGMDGELIVGDPTDKQVFSNTTSGVMSEAGEPDFRYFVFDCWQNPDTPFIDRFGDREVQLTLSSIDRVSLVPWTMITNSLQFIAYEEAALEAGYEGVMVRPYNGKYKYGRSTLNEGYLIKIKRFVDCEGEIIGWEEEMHNMNPAETNELGRTKRSTHQENLVGKGTLGAWKVDIITGPFKGKTVNIGSGFTAAQRKEFWDNRQDKLGTIVKFKYFEPGSKDLPRHPIYLGERHKDDMDGD